ncbi:MAG: TonB-dependent receptor domain-containing protein [Longimicrobiales bacterium]
MPGRNSPATLPASIRACAVLTLTALLAFAPALAEVAVGQEPGRIVGQVVGGRSLEPLGGVQVYLVGTGLGTLTNSQGRFVVLNVDPGTYQVRVERIGFATATQEVTVAAGQAATANFQLEEEVLGLDEIVVTGTAGQARRREIGNSVAQIDLSEVREPLVNVDALLTARTPGMVVLRNSANAGGGAMIRLRGNTSVAMSNQPIVYVDGVRMRSDGLARNVPPTGSQLRSPNDIVSPLNDINPSDIERIEVVKGAAATTLYGTEAAAGVIQIFTKRGHTGQARWTAQIDQGIARVLPFGPDPSERPPSEPAQTESGGTSDFMFINPWLRNAHQQNYSLSVSGGGDAFRYFVSGNWADNQGVLPNDSEEKRTIRGNFTFSPLRDLQFQWNTSYNNTALENTAVGNNAHGLTLNAYRRDRNYRSSEKREDIDPLLNQELTTDIDHLLTAFTLTHTPSSRLTQRFTAGWDQIQQNNRNLRPFGFALAPGGILSDQRVRYTTLTFDYFAGYSFDLGEALGSSFTVGGQAVATDRQETAAYGEDFPGPGEPTVNSAGQTLGFEERVRVVNAGFFAQNMFDYLDRAFLTIGARVDGNSAFGEDFGLQVYPKASLSYVISEEDFWRDWGSMKLRAAWGQSGRAPGAFDAVRTFEPVGWGADPAFFPRNVGNPNLGPERSSELEVGFDAALLDNRLTTEFTYYHQTTEDALFSVRQVPSRGFLLSQLENVGKLKNSGIELALEGTVLRSDALTWTLGGTVFTNKSETVDLGGAPPFSLGNFGWVVEGEAVPVIRADCVTGWDATLDEPEGPEDCIHGPNLPTHVLGLNTSLQLPYGVTLSARGEYQGGHYMYDGAAYNAVVRSVRWPGCFDFYTAQEAGRLDEVSALQRARCTVSTTLSDYFVYPADFAKLRDVTISAPVPERWLPMAQSATLTLSAYNAWKWVNEDFPVFEPEMGNNGGFNVAVRSLLEHVPPPAVYTVSLRVSF